MKLTLVVCVAIAAFLAIYLLRIVNGSQSVVLDIAAPDRISGVVLSAELSRLCSEHASGYESAVGRYGEIFGSTHTTNTADKVALTEVKAVGSSASTQYPRTSFDVVKHFMNGAPKAMYFVRHIMLNRDDRYISNAQVAQLDAIIERYNALIGPLLWHHARMQLREICDTIDACGIRPIALPSIADDRMIRRIAQLVSKSRHQPVGLQDSTDTVQEVYAKIASEPRYVYAVPNSLGNFMVYKNGAYCLSQFPVLPRTDAAFRDIRPLIVDELGYVLAWFIDQGCTNLDLNRLTKDASEYDSAAIRVKT